MPLDSKTVDVNHDEINEFKVQRIHPNFIFNLDEIGVQDFVDGQE